MEIWEIFLPFKRLRLALSLLELISVVVLGGSVCGLKQNIESIDSLTGAGVNIKASSIQCTLQGTPRFPALSVGGDFVVGGAFSLHYTQDAVSYNYTTKPEPPRCTGRLVRK